jgi:hypothetical protein
LPRISKIFDIVKERKVRQNEYTKRKKGEAHEEAPVFGVDYNDLPVWRSFK